MIQTKTNARLILASKNAMTGDILYTWVLTFPRIILAEVNTHRMASRNTSSSRAIPTAKQRSRVYEDPFVPVSVGQNQRGMQASTELSGWRRKAAVAVWRGARLPALAAAYTLEKLGAHKQVANRLVEPWTWTQQVFSATDVNNLFLLRDHGAAEPHFQLLAGQMRLEAEYCEDVFDDLKGLGSDHFDSRHPDSTYYQILRRGEWHLPFIDDGDEADIRALLEPGAYAANTVTEILKKMSAARCARVSYNLPENGKRSDVGRDAELYQRLAGSNPKHLSPLEHQATPMGESRYSGNFRGWKQFRKEIVGEHGGDR